MRIDEEIRDDVAVLRVSGALMSGPDVAPFHDHIKWLIKVWYYPGRGGIFESEMVWKRHAGRADRQFDHDAQCRRGPTVDRNH